MINALEDRLCCHTLPYLAHLLGCSSEEAWDKPCTFQTFPDAPHAKEDAKFRKALTRTYHSSIRLMAEHLDRLNRAGAGVYICVSGTNLQARTKADIREVRGWHADLDRKAEHEPFDARKCPLEPSMIVESGNGLHLYWCMSKPAAVHGLDTMAMQHEQELKAIQRFLEPFGADAAVAEIARVMRLPGYRNTKSRPSKPVRLLSFEGPSYTQAQIRAAFPIEEKRARCEQPSPIKSSASRQGMDALERSARYLTRLDPAIQGQNGSRVTLCAALKVISHFGLSVDQAFMLLRDLWNPLCQPPWEEPELYRKVKEAARILDSRAGRIAS